MLETLNRSSSTMGVSVYGVTSGRDKFKRRKVSITREFPKDCGRCATRLNTKKVLKPLVSEHSKSLDQIELVGGLKDVQTKDTELSKSVNQKESQEPIKGSDGSQPQLVMDFVAKDTPVPLKVADGAGTSYLNLGSIRKEFPPRRSVSAIREYPIGWSNFSRFSNESLKDTSADDNSSGIENKQPKQMAEADSRLIRENVQDDLRSNLKRGVMKDFVENVRVISDRDAMKTKAEHFVVKPIPHSNSAKARVVEENDFNSQATSSIYGSNTNPISLSKKFDKEIADSGKKLDTRSLNVSRNKSFKRKVLEDFENSVCAKDQGGSSIVGSSGERMIVQALMAAKHCPWRNAKGDVKSTTTQGTTRHQIQNQEIVSYKRNSLEYNSSQIICLNAERDAQEHDDMGEKTSSVLRPPCSTLNVIPFGRVASNNEDGVTRSKVRETLRLFQAMFRKLLQEEESRLKVPGTFSKRIHLITVKEMKKQEKWVNTGDKILGHVPGVEVGDEFQFRVELSIIGLHGPFQGGIDHVKKDGKIVATSVVASGGYDDIDNSDVLVYSGQGGNPAGWNKKAQDQKLERGNLALKNSMDEKSPVRVIRGFKEMKGSDHTSGKMVATYTYDGLYLVERYWQEKGRHGNNVYMFELRRIPGQPELALREVQKSKKLRVREGLCVDDISQGEERMRICAVNTLDCEKPPQFKYIAKLKYTSSHNLIPLKGGCECKDGCSDSEKCLCAVMNGGEIPFNHNGALVETKTLVYECGPLCKCPPSCYNRVSQHGIKFQLEIFKTKSRGWGVRSLNSIPSGSFICEYTGEILAEKEADQRTGYDEYLFDLGRSKNSSQSMGAGLSNVIPPDLQSSSISCENVENEGFTIDALEYGNVGRFINHSCSPNLIAQDVLYDHYDKRMPHIMLFAADNIPPLQELTFDYNYVVDTVHDSSSGNIKIKECYCGSIDCTGRMY